MTDTPEQISREILEEFNRATGAYGPFASAHEGYAILLEEVDELWDEIKVKQSNHDLDAMRREAIQIGAMAMRFIHDVTDRPKNSSFWQSVSELAAMRVQIPEERRALSGVRHALRRDVPGMVLSPCDRVRTAFELLPSTALSGYAPDHLRAEQIAAGIAAEVMMAGRDREWFVANRWMQSNPGFWFGWYGLDYPDVFDVDGGHVPTIESQRLRRFNYEVGSILAEILE